MKEASTNITLQPITIWHGTWHPDDNPDDIMVRVTVDGHRFNARISEEAEAKVGLERCKGFIERKARLLISNGRPPKDMLVTQHNFVRVF